MNFALELLLCALLLLGSSFIALGALGLVRLPDFYSRMHGPTMASTLGIVSLALAQMLFFSNQQADLSLRELLLVLFLFISAPVSAFLLAKAAVLQQVPSDPKTQGKAWKQ